MGFHKTKSGEGGVTEPIFIGKVAPSSVGILDRLREQQIAQCDRILLKEFGSKWEEFRNRPEHNEYDKDFLVEVVEELASIYGKLSLAFLADLLGTSRYVVKQWFNTEEIIRAVEDGQKLFEAAIESIPNLLLAGHDDITPDERRTLLTHYALYIRRKAAENTSKPTEELSYRVKKVGFLEKIKEDCKIKSDEQ